MDKQALLRKIKTREVTLGVIGLGYVGLPLAVDKAMCGFKTIGFDVKKSRVDMVNEGESYILDVGDKELQTAVKEYGLRATDDYSELSQVDIVAICVPTPLDKFKQPDMQYIISSCKNLGKYLKKESVVILESTTYPGTTEELIKPILEETSGMCCGEDFYLGFSPERVDPGNVQYKTKNTNRVVGGIGKDATEVIAYFYREILQAEVHEVSTPAVAEMEKLLENTFRNVNIALANEMAMLCNRMGISVWEVIDAAKTKPYGFMAFYPGAGVGGHCIPLDPCYLSWKAKEYDFHTTLIECSTNINDNMCGYCFQRLVKLLGRQKKSVSGAKILFLGVAYKQDIADERESPAIKFVEMARENFAEVQFYDPFVYQYTYNNNIRYGLPHLTSEELQWADVVVISTAHSNLDYQMVLNNSRQIFDIKNRMKKFTPRDHIEVL